jgi:hypothetical protein
VANWTKSPEFVLGLLAASKGWVIDELDSNSVGITTIETPCTVTMCTRGFHNFDVSARQIGMPGIDIVFVIDKESDMVQLLVN